MPWDFDSHANGSADFVCGHSLEADSVRVFGPFEWLWRLVTYTGNTGASKANLA